MTKLRTVLAAAAALVATGVTVGVALNQAGVAEGMTATEWCAAIDRVNDVQKKDHFFVAVQPGNPIPEQAGGRLLGECSGGTCMIKPDAVDGGLTYRAEVAAEECNPEPQCDVEGPFAGHCIYTHNADGLTRPPDIGTEWKTTGSWGCAYTYTYDCGPEVNGWRVCDVYAHPYIAKGWMLAANEYEYLRWYGSMAAVVTACLEHFTGPECLNLLQADNRCWLLDDGRVCRYGALLGADEACPYARVQARLPCVVNRGAGSEMRDAQRVWTDEEMDEL